MPKVTKEVMKSLIDDGVFPPRHSQGCPKNYLRMIPLCGAAKGWTAEKIKDYIKEQEPGFPCSCGG